MRSRHARRASEVLRESSRHSGSLHREYRIYLQIVALHEPKRWNSLVRPVNHRRARLLIIANDDNPIDPLAHALDMRDENHRLEPVFQSVEQLQNIIASG